MSKDSGNDRNIDQIRSLIFGDQMQAYEERFKELQQEVRQLNQQVSDSLSEIRSAIESLRSSGEQSAGQLNDALAKSEKSMRSMLEGTATRLQEAIATVAADSVDRADLAGLFGETARKLQKTGTPRANNGSSESHD